MSHNDALRGLIRELKDEELDEVTSSSATPGYMIPGAFVGPKGKKPQKKGIDKKDHTPVKFGGNGGALKEDASNPLVSENRYVAYKMAEGTPRQKIGRAIREINAQLTELDRVVRMNARLKTETNLQSGEMWKSTAKGLAKLEGKLVSIANRLRELKA